MKSTASNETRSLSASIEQYLTVLTRHWRLILLSALALFVPLATGVMLMPSVYEATTTIMVDPQRIPDKYVSTTVIDEPSERLNLLTQEVLSSSRLEQVIQDLNLYGKMRERKGRDEVLEYMRSKIQIQTKHTSGSGPSSFTLTFAADSPVIAALTANKLAESFIRRHLQSRQEQVEGTTSFLANELAETRTSLQKQEQQISAYRMQHLGEMPEQMQANLQALAQLQMELQTNSDQISRLEEERIVLERTPEVAHDGTSSATLSARASLLAQIASKQAQVVDLESRYTPAHPDLLAARQSLAELRAELKSAGGAGGSVSSDPVRQVRLEVLAREKSRLEVQQVAIRQKIGLYQAKVDVVPLRQEELTNLTRDYESAKEHYRSLLDKTYSAQMATNLEENQQGERFQVLDRAVPPDKAARPNRPRFLIGAGFLALIGGFGIAFLRELADKSVKTQAELEQLLGAVELLGTVPRLQQAPAAVPKRRTA